MIIGATDRNSEQAVFIPDEQARQFDAALTLLREAHIEQHMNLRRDVSLDPEDSKETYWARRTANV